MTTTATTSVHPSTSSATRSRRLAAVAMAAAAGLAIAGFSVLGAVFDYPAVLDEPTTEILRSFHEHQSAVMTWFAVLCVSAALLAPVGILLGRLTGGRLGRAVAVVGVAASVVQVVGLSRWFLFVPGISDDALDPARAADAADTFDTLHTWLGKALGETVGYALTATFTVLLVLGLIRHVAPRWVTWLGYGSAALIATGVVIPLGLEAASITNFVGYVAWCLWLIVTAVVLWRTRDGADASSR